MKYVLSLLLMTPLLGTAQENEAAGTAPAAVCSTDKYRQFDFWIGDWNVSSNGQAALAGACFLMDCTRSRVTIDETW
jgi:hypothetical protein